MDGAGLDRSFSRSSSRLFDFQVVQASPQFLMRAILEIGIWHTARERSEDQFPVIPEWSETALSFERFEIKRALARAKCRAVCMIASSLRVNRNVKRFFNERRQKEIDNLNRYIQTVLTPSIVGGRNSTVDICIYKGYKL